MTKKKMKPPIARPDPERVAWAQSLEAAAFARAEQVVLDAPRASFGLSDFFDQKTWILLVDAGLGPRVLGAVLDATAHALLVQGIRSSDLVLCLPELPVPSEPGDVYAVRGWLADRMVSESDRRTSFPEPDTTLAGRGWTRNRLRVTSLIFTVLALGVTSIAAAGMKSASRQRVARASESQLGVRAAG